MQLQNEVSELQAENQDRGDRIAELECLNATMSTKLNQKEQTEEASAQSFLREQLREMTGVLEDFDRKYERKEMQLQGAREQLDGAVEENRELRINCEAAMHDLDRAERALAENNSHHREDLMRMQE